MKMKKICELVVFLVASSLLGLVSIAEAHTLKGSLPVSKTAIKKWKYTCLAPPPPTQMIFRISQAKKADFSVKVVVTGPNGESSELISLPLKDTFTPYSSLKGGAGDYILTLSKVGTNPNKAMTYTVESHCDTDNGQHTQQNGPKPVK